VVATRLPLLWLAAVGAVGARLFLQAVNPQREQEQKQEQQLEEEEGPREEAEAREADF
jgi:hypothetical protein